MRLISVVLLLVACGDKDIDTGEPADLDGDGYFGFEDCNDLSAAESPDAAELCDGIDNDCDGQTDEDVVDPTLGYADADGDGFGDASVRVEMCEGVTPNAVADDTDCDDADPTSFPGGAEVCDGADNDCDDETDEEGDGAVAWYRDDDEDGYGDADHGETNCEQPDGYVSDDTDCDDDEATVYPGGEEICDELDNDCDDETDEDGQEWFYDEDGDGEGGASAGVASCEQENGWIATDTDCDDADPFINTAGFELCDGVDNDCDDEADEETDACACDGVLVDGQPVLFCPFGQSANLSASTCEGLGLQLVEIADAEENAWIAETAADFGIDELWMGYTDEDDDGTWAWSSGAETTYEGWAAEEPADVARYYCAYMTVADGAWAATLCATELAYVCEGI